MANEQREEVILFSEQPGNTRKMALEKYNVSLSAFKRWKKEYYKERGHLDRRYAKQSRIETYPIQCAIIRQFLFDHKKWVQKRFGEDGCYGKGQWSKAKLIKHLYRSIYPRVHLSTVYRIYDDAIKTINNPKTAYLIAWDYDREMYRF